MLNADEVTLKTKDKIISRVKCKTKTLAKPYKTQHIYVNSFMDHTLPWQKLATPESARGKHTQGSTCVTDCPNDTQALSQNKLF